MLIHSAIFVKSSAAARQCPNNNLPDIAMAGRSNVGKSSLINMLAANKTLAKTSGTPGKTRLINHYLINNKWYLADLPGYGYAKTGRQQRQQFARIINDYLLNRNALLLLYLLIDCRLPPQRIDLDFVRLLGNAGIPFHIIFTKTDKITKPILNSTITQWNRALQEEWEEVPKMILTSSISGAGRAELLADIAQCLPLHNAANIYSNE